MVARGVNGDGARGRERVSERLRAMVRRSERRWLGE
ncbi:hypothetical protein L195_g061829 [Trifolium pratense]|uniref:Uncharacterized protein n=1 Tax=Trifolium pratense TaxID=57577 RepID=A0A2K3KC36_TRIPR|nr:hypothetical protein L195_g061829 [Trifolium pratense]